MARPKPTFIATQAAAIVFNAGWMVTMIGSDVGERTLITRKHLADFRSTVRKAISSRNWPTST